MLPTQVQKQCYARDGGVKAPEFLTPDQMVRSRACFDWGMANPGPSRSPYTVAPRMSTTSTT